MPKYIYDNGYDTIKMQIYIRILLPARYYISIDTQSCKRNTQKIYIQYDYLPHIRVAHQLSPRGRQVKLEFARFHIFAEGRHFAARSTWNAQHCSHTLSKETYASVKRNV